VTFSWDHLGISRQSGQFLQLRGQLEFNPTDPESGRVEVVIPVASVFTGVKELDEALRSADFFNAARFPEIAFKSTGVVKTGDRTGDVTGDLTMMGVTRPATLRVTWNFTGEHPLASINPVYTKKWISGFSAETRILRSEWGLSRALPLVSDEIRISIEVELMRKDRD